MALAYGKFRLTYDDYVQLSEQKRGELIDGDFFVSPSPSSKHQALSREIGMRLELFVDEKQLGSVFRAPMDVKFDEHDTVQPDIFFIAKEHLSIIQENFIAGSPDFIIEILSPATRQMDLIAKLHLYSKFGVREYWIVDPMTETIHVHDFKENQLELRQAFPKGSSVPSNVIDGFQLNTTHIF